MNKLFFQLGGLVFSHQTAVELNTINTITSYSSIAEGEIVTLIVIALDNSEYELLVRYLAKLPDTVLFETSIKRFTKGVHFSIILHDNRFHIHHHF